MEILSKLINSKEYVSKFENSKKYENWISRKVVNGEVVKVRSGLYALVDNSSGEIFPSKFEIAREISSTAYVAYHGALEYYGVANQVFNKLVVCSRSRFNSFEFQDIEYIYKEDTLKLKVMDVVQAGVRVTSVERTIVDCLDKINLAGGTEEFLQALDQISFIRESEILKILKVYNKKILYQKVGYVLSLHKERLGISDVFFEECKTHLPKRTNYFGEDIYSEFSYNAEWNLMVQKQKSNSYGEW